MFATIPPPPERLLVFARLPEAGKVKSRLAAEIGEARALGLYEAMLRDTLSTIGPSGPEREIEVVWAPSENANAETLRRAFGDRALSMQTGNDLGDRMAMAFSERFFFHRTEKIIAIGVDDPSLTRETIDHAFALLESCEWVLGPAKDGGYYLIGCRAAAFDTEVFQGIEWGSARVLPSTLDKIRNWTATVAELPLHTDIDVAQDLKEVNAVGETGALIRSWTQS
jgi:uncharacterized protein